MSASAMLALLAASALLSLLSQLGRALLAPPRVQARRAQRQLSLGESDTLIQGVQGLMLSVQAAASRLPDASPVRVQLEALLDDGEQLLTSARQRMRAASPGLRPDDQLRAALLALAQQCAGQPAPGIALTIVGREQPVSPALQRMLYQWAGKLIRNASPQARTIEVELCYAWGSLGLRIRHDAPAEAARSELIDILDILNLGAVSRRRLPRVEIWSSALVGSEYAVCYDAAYPTGAQSGWQRRWHGLQKVLYRHA